MEVKATQPSLTQRRAQHLEPWRCIFYFLAGVQQLHYKESLAHGRDCASRGNPKKMWFSAWLFFVTPKIVGSNNGHARGLRNLRFRGFLRDVFDRRTSSGPRPRRGREPKTIQNRVDLPTYPTGSGFTNQEMNHTESPIIMGVGRQPRVLRKLGGSPVLANIKRNTCFLLKTQIETLPKDSTWLWESVLVWDAFWCF